MRWWSVPSYRAGARRREVEEGGGVLEGVCSSVQWKVSVLDYICTTSLLSVSNGQAINKDNTAERDAAAVAHYEGVACMFATWQHGSRFATRQGFEKEI